MEGRPSLNDDGGLFEVCKTRDCFNFLDSQLSLEKGYCGTCLSRKNSSDSTSSATAANNANERHKFQGTTPQPNIDPQLKDLSDQMPDEFQHFYHQAAPPIVGSHIQQHITSTPRSQAVSGNYNTSSSTSSPGVPGAQAHPQMAQLFATPSTGIQQLAFAGMQRSPMETPGSHSWQRYQHADAIYEAPGMNQQVRPYYDPEQTDARHRIHQQMPPMTRDSEVYSWPSYPQAGGQNLARNTSISYQQHPATPFYGQPPSFSHNMSTPQASQLIDDMSSPQLSTTTFAGSETMSPSVPPVSAAQNAGHRLAPLRPRARKPRTTSATPKQSTPGAKRACIEGCGRGAGAPGRERCSRHHNSWLRNNALPPTLPLMPEIDHAAAQLMAYPMLDGLISRHKDATLHDTANSEVAWVQRFLTAIETPYEAGSDAEQDGFHIDQQKTFNGNALMESQGRYSLPWINARVRMLYQTAYRFHAGGQAVYPFGGDSGGYGKPNVQLSFSERLKIMEEFLLKNKLIAMDVVEGKGVMAFVAHPRNYAKRKKQNKNSNKKKDEALEAQRMVERGRSTAGLEEEGDEGGSEVEDEDDDDDDAKPTIEVGEVERQPFSRAKGKKKAPAPSPAAPRKKRKLAKKDTPADAGQEASSSRHESLQQEGFADLRLSSGAQQAFPTPGDAHNAVYRELPANEHPDADELFGPQEHSWSRELSADLSGPGGGFRFGEHDL